MQKYLITLKVTAVISRTIKASSLEDALKCAQTEAVYSGDTFIRARSPWAVEYGCDTKPLSVGVE